VTVQTVSGKV